MAQDVATVKWVLDELQPLDDCLAYRLSVTLKPSTTFSKGAVLGYITSGASSGTYGVYASGNTDGSQYAECLLSRAVATDSAGNITYGGQSGGGEFSETWPSVPAYFGGVFNVSDLSGLDTNALTNSLSGKYIKNKQYLCF